MDKSQYNERLKNIESSYQQEKKELAKAYAFANNPYKVGDILRDHFQTLKITYIGWGFGTFNDFPACTYQGVILKKDLTPRKDLMNGVMWQNNVEEKINL